MLRASALLLISASVPFAILLVVPMVLRNMDPDYFATKYDLAVGKRIFASQCSRCHSIKETGPEELGPSLARVGKLAESRRPGMSAVAYLLESVTAPGAFKAPGQSGSMPAGMVEKLSDDDLRALLAYLLAQGGTANDYELSNVSNEKTENHALEQIGLTRREIELGEAMFREKGRCIECHAFYSKKEHHTKGPNLFWRGYTDPERIRNHIVNPSLEIAHPYTEHQVLLKSGTLHVGHIIDKSSDRLRLWTKLGEEWRIIDIPTNDIEHDGDDDPLVVPTRVSPMPKGLDELLSDEELQALITFLHAMN